MKQILNNLLALIVPDVCVQCGKTLMPGERTLCLTCQSKLPRVRGGGSENAAEDRLLGKFHFEHGTSFCYYRKGGDFAHLITSAKYHNRPWVNKHLANIFATELSEAGWPFDIDVIVPVPVHQLRLLMRGYNQTLPIAEALSDAWNLPIDSKSLRKNTYTKSQVGQSLLQRLDRIDGTFRLKNQDRFWGCHVLLVDDVLTSGATIDACAQLFVEAGARVSFLTLGLSD